jgi:hypothetical protein
MAGFSNPFAPKRSASYAEFIIRIKGWTCAVLALDATVMISVNELACAEEGCPPRETVILVMTDAAAPRRGTIHKAMSAVTADDVQAAFAGVRET